MTTDIDNVLPSQPKPAPLDYEAGPVSSADTLGQKTIWNMLAMVTNIGSSTVAGIVVARVLGPKGVGEIGYMIWLATFLATAFSLGLPFAITKFLAEYLGRRDESTRLILTRWTSRSHLGGLAAGCGLVLVASLLPSAARHLGSLGAAWLLAYVVFTALSNFYQAYLAGSQQFRLAAKLSAASAVLQVVLVAIGVKWAGERGAIAGYIGFLVIPAIASLALLVSGKAGAGALEPGLRQRMLRFSVQTWLATLLGAVVWTRAELFFLERSFPKEVVGYFNVALSIAALATQIPVLLSGALLPHMAQRLGEGDVATVQALYASATRILAFVAFPIAAVIAGAAHVIVPLMYGQRFEPAAGATAILVAVAAIGATATAGSSLVYAAERSSFVLMCGVFGTVAVFVAGLTVIPRFGASGAAWSRAVIQVAFVGWGMAFIAKSLHYRPPITSLLKTAAAAGASAVAAWGVTLAWQSSLALLPAVAAAGLVFLVAVLLLKPLESEDIHALRQIVGRFFGRRRAGGTA